MTIEPANPDYAASCWPSPRIRISSQLQRLLVGYLFGSQISCPHPDIFARALVLADGRRQVSKLDMSGPTSAVALKVVMWVPTGSFPVAATWSLGSTPFGSDLGGGNSMTGETYLY